jgi:hypothetical protein
MSSVTPTPRRLTNVVKQALREVSLRLVVLNHQVGARLKLRDVDFDCLHLLHQHGPAGPGTLAKLAGLHPATMTGVLDRLEVVIRGVRGRGGEVLRLYGGMSDSMDEICAAYTPEQLEVIADFLRRTAAAGEKAVAELGE